MNEPLRWRGMEISENAAMELRLLYDCIDYLIALRDNIREPGVPRIVDSVIRVECRVLLERLEPYNTFHQQPEEPS